jgi:sigma-B regulation protein RsbU (phosphoserine phosphatase)
VNSRLYKDIQRNMFVALFYGIINPQTRRLSYSNAGQSEPILYRNDQVSFLPKDADDNHTALGMAKSADYQQYQLKLRSNDVLVFYTDGLVEMMDGSSEPYGFDRLFAAIHRHAGSDSSGMVREVLDEVAAYSGNENFHDDVTMVVVKID